MRQARRGIIARGVTRPVVADFLAYYKLDGNHKDYNRTYDGTNHGGAATSGVKGLANTAIVYDGLTDWADTNSTFGFTDGDDMTISMWLYIEGYQGSVGFRAFGGYDRDAVNGMTIGGFTDGGANINSIQFTNFQSSGNLRFIRATGNAVNTWIHVVATCEGDGTIELFIDKVSSGTTTTSGTVNTSNFSTRDFVFAAEAWYNGSAGEGSEYDGKIDNVRVYNRILTQTEINSIYADES